MFHIVAMEHKGAFECAESHQQLDFTVAIENVQIAFEAVVQRWLSAVVTDDLVRLEVHVDGVPPATTAIAADPAFNCTQLWSRVGKVRIVKLLVDLPRTVSPMEFERACDDCLAGLDHVMRSECSSDCNCGAVRLAFALDDEFQERHRNVQPTWVVE